MLQESLTAELKRIVYKAGKLITGRTGPADAAVKEGHANYVTEYDLKVQEFLRRELGRVMPEAGFLGEENERTGQEIHSGYVFIVDPIDGTTNFMCDFRFSAVSVAMACDGRVEAGFVYNPFRGEMFHAVRGKGAYLNDRPIQVEKGSLSDGVAVFDNVPYYPEMRTDSMRLAEEISYQAMDLRTMGSAALSLCYVACGRGIVYECMRLCTWDYAAASVIIEEAGGVICGFDGQELQLRNNTAVAAGSPEAMKELLPFITKYSDRI